jgi:hypothetical protein
MMFFQQMLPELFTYFEDEEVGPNDWAVSWIRVRTCTAAHAARTRRTRTHMTHSGYTQFLLAKELPMDCVLRLWDTYFSCAEGLGLHLYTMLAILVNFHEELIELEHSELKGFLQHLPEMDMDQVYIDHSLFASRVLLLQDRFAYTCSSPWLDHRAGVQHQGRCISTRTPLK